jgi:hypothetical protein
LDRGRSNGLYKSVRHSLLDHYSTNVETVHAASGDEIFAGAVIPRSRIPAAIVHMQTAAAVTARDEALQQRRSFSHRSSCVMRHRSDVGIEPRLISLKSLPIDEAGMMPLNENGPLIHGQMTGAFFDDTVLINVAFVLSLAVRISASIHRIGEDAVEGVVSRRHPADRTR